MTTYTELNRQFINGKWIDGSTTTTMQNLNPFTGKVIHTLSSASTADVDTAFVAAKQAFGSWAATNPLVRRGDPGDRQTIINPLIDNKAILRIQAMIDESIKQGAIVETGNLVQGNVLQPTVLSGMTIDMPIFKDEIFGPADGIMSFATDEEAIALANATDYGLNGALHTRDIYRGMELARKVETGMIHINDQSDNDEVHAPFGGEKSSGTGRFGGDFILEEMTTVQWVSVAHEPRQYPF